MLHHSKPHFLGASAVVAALILSTFSAPPAFAAHGESHLVSMHQEELAQNSKNGELIKIAGLLSCSVGEANTGEPCVLTIRDQKTGKSYNLTNGNEVMSLYQSGVKRVAIEGSYQGEETLHVARVAGMNTGE